MLVAGKIPVIFIIAGKVAAYYELLLIWDCNSVIDNYSNISVLLATAAHKHVAFNGTLMLKSTKNALFLLKSQAWVILSSM